MTEANAPAYPVETNPEEHGMHPGLTKREYFAGLALQGLLSNPELGKALAKVKKEERQNFLAETAVYAADALIAELSKPEQP